MEPGHSVDKSSPLRLPAIALVLVLGGACGQASKVAPQQQEGVKSSADAAYTATPAATNEAGRAAEEGPKRKLPKSLSKTQAPSARSSTASLTTPELAPVVSETISSAPDPGGQMVTITTEAPVFVTARRAPRPIKIANQGSVLRLVGMEGDWFRVEFDDPKWGRRVGFVEKTSAVISSPKGYLQPLDLSIRDRKSETAPVDLSIRNLK
jgi:hypothetical protein